MVFHYFQRCDLLKFTEKSLKNLPQTFPKPPKIEQKSEKIFEKNQHESRDTKKCEKLQKISQHGPKSPPKGRDHKLPTASALPCLVLNLEFKKH